MGWDVRGIIEGFYGPPWSWDQRAAVMRFGHERGLTHYVYAPKDDPLHRERWREPYGADALAGFAQLLAEDTMQVGFALSPGLSIDYHDGDDRDALAAKIGQLVDVGVTLICLALDDIPVRPGLGPDHAAITTWLRDHLGDRAALLLVPTEYTGTAATPYLDALAAGVPDDVPIAWTGRTVVCDAITTDEASARAASLGGRPPLVWDNYPVNDATMTDHLFVGPLRGRSSDLGQQCAGYLANPMTQPLASLLPLASIAGYLRGDDPEAVWVDEGDALGWRTFAEACDGETPRRLVADLVAADASGDDHDWLDALDRLRAWLKQAEACAVPDELRPEVEPWLDQVHTEAALGLTAVRAIERVRLNRHRPGEPPDRADAMDRVFTMALQWQKARRAEHTVMGDRLGIRVVFGQDAHGEWVLHRDAITEDRNAIDALARFTLATIGVGE